MRNYLKIFFITITIQIVAVALGCYSAFPILIIVGYVISLATDICLAVKINTAWYKKLIYIFLMPTNYTPIGLLWFAMYCLGKFFEMLPANLG